jgi:hypothetical protein
MNVRELVDQFVILIDPTGTVFRKVESVPWIDALETKLPRRLPASLLLIALLGGTVVAQSEDFSKLRRMFLYDRTMPLDVREIGVEN